MLSPLVVAFQNCVSIMAQAYRVYYKQQGEEVVNLLAGGDKRTQGKDIKIALRLAQNI